MGENATKLKKHFENLKKLGLDLTLVKGWETTIQKYGEWEDLVIGKIVPAYPQAQKAAADPQLANSGMMKQFNALQMEGVKKTQELKAPVHNLWHNRAKLQDVIKKIPDKKKQTAITNEFIAGNSFANIMDVQINTQNSCLRPVAIKPPALVAQVRHEQAARGQVAGARARADSDPSKNYNTTEDNYN